MSETRLCTSDGCEDDYRLTGLVGRGSFGVVLKAVHLESGREVAIKRITQKKSHRNEIDLIREIFAMRNATHKNVCLFLKCAKSLFKSELVVHLFDVILSPDTVSLVIEYVESNLKLAIEDHNRPLNDEIPRYYMYQLFTGVSYLHSLNIMHRVRYQIASKNPTSLYPVAVLFD
ncbi:unnamed protein product [Gongylonema pulchrum]|uniref:Protein kinase domain-containing protein n=1 Tax=Gongylonema pulchrum TaxID=637853 RepID=A0A183DF94_9BILA|nr:unnamed protein product [Gongylonema pulchrum]